MKSAINSRLYTKLEKHHPMTIALHWGTLMCIVIAVATVLLCEIIGDKLWRQLLIESHRQLGLLVLLGVAVRLYVRRRFGMANHMSGLPLPMRLAASAVQWSLYGLLVGLPLLGWATTNAHNLPVRLFGLIHLPALAEVDSELADQLSDYHVLGAWMLLALVSLHALAALHHHFIRRDAVLAAMLPSRDDAVPTGAAKPTRGKVGLIG
jgi:cytochrome b561